MKLNFTKILIALFALIIFMPTTFAKEIKKIYYTNNNGIEMTQKEYEFLNELFNESYIENMTQEKFENLAKGLVDYELDEEKVQYIKTSTFRDPNGETFSYDTIISKEEYDNFVKPQTRTTCTGTDLIACWETNAKKLTMEIMNLTFTNNVKVLDILTKIHWKTIPATKSYDLLGLRWDTLPSTLTYRDMIAAQEVSDGTFPVYQHFDYDTNSSNTNSATNGIGVSMNLYDNVSGSLRHHGMELVSFTKTGNGTIHAYASYQHATSSLTLAQSKSYTFSSSGLGKVQYFSNSTIKNKYDNMQGLDVQIAYFQ